MNQRVENSYASLWIKASGSSMTPVNFYHTCKVSHYNSRLLSDGRQDNESHKYNDAVIPKISQMNM
jgi:hypothetical protein